MTLVIHYVNTQRGEDGFVIAFDLPIRFGMIGRLEVVLVVHDGHTSLNNFEVKH